MNHKGMKYIKVFLNGFIEGWIWVYTIPFAAIMSLVGKCKDMSDMDKVGIIVSTVFYVLLPLAAYGLGFLVRGE